MTGKRYAAETKKKWGKVGDWTKEEFEKIKKESDDIAGDVANAAEKGVESPEVQQIMLRHFQLINKFYDCSYETYRDLGKMYVEDKRFYNNYEKIKPRLAEFMRNAMIYFADENEK